MMKKKSITAAIVTFVLMTGILILPIMTAQAEPFAQPKNPVVKAIFTADPEAHVWPTEPDKLYIYPSHDPYPATGSDKMDMYHVFSTTNMTDFVDEGEIVRRSDLHNYSWITPSTSERSFMWAPDAAYKDGWYYFYFPVVANVNNWGATWETSVVRSRYPDHGFEQIPAEDVDANPGKPWEGYIRDSGSIDGYRNMYDVCVRVYDGEAYMYNGAAQTLWQGKLKDDMVTLDGELELVSTDNMAVANEYGDPSAYRRLTNYHEGPSAFRRNGKYYLIYPGGAGSYGGMSGDSFYYCIADTPLGPWSDAQIFFNPTDCGTSHGSIVEFKDKWYWVYHTSDISTNDAERSVCIDEVIFNEDGTIQRFSKTYEGVPQNGPDYVRPTGFNLAADEALLSGTGTRPTLSTDETAGHNGQVLQNAGANNTAITFNNVDGGTGQRARLIFHYSTDNTAKESMSKLNLFVNGVDYKNVSFPQSATSGSTNYVEIAHTVRALNPGETNTIELRGYNQNGRLTLNYVEVVLLDDTAPAPGYFDVNITQAAGGSATADWLLEDAGAALSVAAGSEVTLSYEEGAGEFDGWAVVKPEGLEITDNKFFMPYGEVEIRPVFDTAGNARRPIIEAQPEGLTTIAGMDGTLSVSAMVKDAGTLSYQWYRNTSLSNADGTPVNGATNAAFDIPTDITGTFYYYCVITNTFPGASGPEKSAFVTTEAATVTVVPPPSTACDVINLPASYAVAGNQITATVSNHNVAANLNEIISVSDEATWLLYSDAARTQEANKVVSPLLSGDNVRYITVTAEDGLTTKEYTITITRLSSSVGRFVTAPPMDGTLNPADWGEKVFRLAEGEESTIVNAFNPTPGYPPEGFSADIYMAYDAANVYLGMVVNDPLWTPARAGDGTLWQGCAFQINFWNSRNEGARSEYGFGLTANGPTHHQWAAGAGTAINAAYNNYSIQRVGETDTFIYTIAIPASSFRQNAAANPLTADEELWFSIAYNYPSATNITCAMDMGFHSKALGDARSLTLGEEIGTVIPNDPENRIIGGVIENNTLKSLAIETVAPADTMVTVASYDVDGKMLDIIVLSPTTVGEETFTLNFDVSGAPSVKAFMWNKNTFVPLIEASELIGSR